ncbi:DUF4214 domain-containing protein [Pararhizobium haloflavum]|uniref:DUF4214 domain-containing protein n=1 Tax=Pararhizobium haloflavum TaxID=2037914 RepID=UPI0018E43DCB|nr:DUF4214 domain-containing protein [Pararhizobium haloflavum]
MAQLVFQKAFDLLSVNEFRGEFVEQTAERIVGSDGVSTAYYYGQFTIFPDGDFSGTLDGIEYFEGDDLIFVANDFSVDAAEFGALIRTDQVEAAVALVLGGNDTVYGSNGDDVLVGAGGDDVLFGATGDDEFHAGNGSNTIHGDDGFDVAYYDGPASEWTVASAETGFTVSHDSGTDTLANVERLAFSDTMIALDVFGNAGAAFRIYEAAFDRAPDASEVGYWISNMDAGWTLEDVAARFVDTPEFAALYGENPSNAEFVDRVYFNVLDRQADEGGAAYWQGELDAGAMSQAEVLARISESGENVDGVMPQIENGIWYTV